MYSYLQSPGSKSFLNPQWCHSISTKVSDTKLLPSLQKRLVQLGRVLVLVVQLPAQFTWKCWKLWSSFQTCFKITRIPCGSWVWTHARFLTGLQAYFLSQQTRWVISSRASNFSFIIRLIVNIPHQPPPPPPPPKKKQHRSMNVTYQYRIFS